MAESQGGWWDWIQSAKEKVVEQSSEVIGFVRRDIEEFSNVVSQEASSVVTGTASTLKEKFKLNDANSSANQVKKSVSGFFSHVAEVFTPSPEDEDEEAILVWKDEPVSLTRLEAAKYALFSNPSNFSKRSLDSEELYNEWLRQFDEDSHAKQLSSILSQNEPLQRCYSALVPDQLTHNEFCLRYFYEMDKLQKAEERRMEMRKRVNAMTDKSKTSWGDDDEIDESKEISEEMQKRLLEDYEKEVHDNAALGGEDLTKGSNENSENDHAVQALLSECESKLPSTSSDISETRKERSKSSTPSKDTEDEWEKVDSIME